jgi:hypothetical protein
MTVMSSNPNVSSQAESARTVVSRREVDDDLRDHRATEARGVERGGRRFSICCCTSPVSVAFAANSKLSWQGFLVSIAIPASAAIIASN